MPTSPRFDQLKIRINELEVNVLPAIDITGNYSPRDLDLTRAFCLLSHAEIEAYVEDIVQEVVRDVFNHWSADKSRIPEILVNLACAYKSKNEPVATLINQGRLAFDKMIAKNHGIREHNIDAIFRPIGYPIDRTLVTALDSFGRVRGGLAHSSISTQTQIDPLTEKSTVSQLLIELEAFDLDFFAYRNPATHSVIIQAKRSLLDRLGSAIKILLRG